MRKTSLLLIIAFYCLSVGICIAQNKNNPVQEDAILTATDNLFQFMKARDYVAVWKNISFKTRRIIVDDVQKAFKKTGTAISEKELEKDFIFGGAIAKDYWDSYLSVFDADIVLRQCKWEMGRVEKEEAEVVLHCKKSENPTILKIYRENDAWRVGLEESFGSRRLNPF